MAGVGDFNSDGHPDLLWRHTITGDNRIGFLRLGTLVSEQPLPRNDDLQWIPVMLADFDSDGQTDVLWRHHTTGQHIVWLLTGGEYRSYAYLDTVADVTWQLGPEQYAGTGGDAPLAAPAPGVRTDVLTEDATALLRTPAPAGAPGVPRAPAPTEAAALASSAGAPSPVPSGTAGPQRAPADPTQAGPTRRTAPARSESPVPEASSTPLATLPSGQPPIPEALSLEAGVVVEYYHLDTLGSVRAVTDETGQVVRRHDYFSFGDEFNAQPGGDARRFTGKERDAETAFDYFGARYYRNVWGRFTTPDPLLNATAALGDPQRWNRYAYVYNRPLVMVDPDGREAGYVYLPGGQMASPFKAPVFVSERGAKLAMAVIVAGGAAEIAPAAAGTLRIVGTLATSLGLLHSDKAPDIVGGALEFFTGAELGPASTIRSEVSRTISDGHAFGKHGQEFAQFGIRTRSQLADLVEQIMERAGGKDVRYLNRGRVAFWDDVTQAVVIFDPNNSNYGTIFRPGNGRVYFEGLQ